MASKDCRSTDDELLSAYIDRALSPELARTVENRLAEEPAFAARLEALRDADERARAEAARIDAQPMSRPLASLLHRLEGEAGGKLASSNVVAFPLWRRARRFATEHRAFAASVAALAAGFSLAHFLSAPAAPAIWSEDGRIVSRSQLARALETRLSGEPAAVNARATFVARLSFRTEEGALCRVFDLETARARARNVACRTGEDGWRLAASSFSPALATAPEGTYAAASGARDPVIEAYIDAAIAGEPLSRAEESELIARGWRAPERPGSVN
ncbi:hypothetical protein [Amphiplicatus metriothermophilus]|uniref:Transmembrane transcriptional regulator (Anti-sigma factor RsiW) n=1 Tax=Amphiplicatus metriothermophilus TaxID=1519374 RepID=A0A239PV10_9PROT|nr:hypothetical protein [Amphiplicatus metriothermophilus]MBB5519575.1 anti-sigma factor RsiW [Amphiplicatus metriothermophilus]SNT74139.1 hypothetical protein SAMN06297382_2046 [Amphiplicatus metriothermophilus]